MPTIKVRRPSEPPLRVRWSDGRATIFATRDGRNRIVARLPAEIVSANWADGTPAHIPPGYHAMMAGDSFDIFYPGHTPANINDDYQPSNEETNMNIAQDLLTARIVRVRFPGTDKDYAYFTDDATIAEGDYVAVVSPYSSVGGHDDALGGSLTLVRVTGTEETVDAIRKVTKWIVAKVDVSDYVAKQEARAKRALLQAKLQRVIEETRASIDLDVLADRNPALKALVEELKGLGA